MIFGRSFIYTSIIIMLLIVLSAASLSTYAQFNYGKTYSPPLLYNPVVVQQNLIAEMIDKYNPRLNSNQKALMTESIIKQSSSLDLDPFYVTGVIAAESSFMPNAKSPCLARGLMQITDAVIEMMNINNPFDIKQNIYAGTRYLKQLKLQFNQDELALAAYNAGPTLVARLGRIPRIKETINYIRKVNTFRKLMVQDLKFTIHKLTVTPPIFSKLISGENYKLPKIQPSPPEDANFLGLVYDLTEQKRSLIFPIHT